MIIGYSGVTFARMYVHGTLSFHKTAVYQNFTLQWTKENQH
ncbi:MAG: hypothetical protein P4L35_08025 [Ignavibacteriaceae bacterium]|nr:hypothetical protein [Ignavibacteriaceae bacterium]